MPIKRHPQTRMTVKTVYFWSHSWRQWEWDRKRRTSYRVLSNQLTMKWVAFILQGCFNISLHAPLGGPAQEEVQVCVICTHQISPIRVGVTYRTLRSCRGCKVTFNSCGGGEQKDTDVDCTLEHSRDRVEERGRSSTLGTVSIYLHWQYTWQTEKREESTDRRSYHSAAAGALLWAREQWQCPQGCIMSIALLAKVISCIGWASRKSQQINEETPSPNLQSDLYVQTCPQFWSTTWKARSDVPGMHLTSVYQRGSPLPSGSSWSRCPPFLFMEAKLVFHRKSHDFFLWGLWFII